MEKENYYEIGGVKITRTEAGLMGMASFAGFMYGLHKTQGQSLFMRYIKSSFYAMLFSGFGAGLGKVVSKPIVNIKTEPNGKIQ